MLHLHGKCCKSTYSCLVKGCIFILLQHLCSAPRAEMGRSGSSYRSISLTIYRLFTFLVLLILLLVCLRDKQADDLYQALIAKYAFTQPDNLMSLTLPLPFIFLWNINFHHYEQGDGKRRRRKRRKRRRTRKN